MIVDALPLCCRMGLAYVGKASKAEPHQLQNSEFGAFIYAHNCVGDWRKFDDAYPCPGRALRRS